MYIINDCIITKVPGKLNYSIFISCLSLWFCSMITVQLRKQDAFQSRLSHATKMKKIRENQHRNRAENRQPEQDKSKNPGVFPQHPSTAFLIAVCLRSYNLISISPLGFQSLWTARDHGTCACTRPAADKKKCGNWAGLSSRTACSHLLIIRIQLKPNNSVWMRFEHNVLHPLKQTWDRLKREEIGIIYLHKKIMLYSDSITPTLTYKHTSGYMTGWMTNRRCKQTSVAGTNSRLMTEVKGRTEFNDLHTI